MTTLVQHKVGETALNQATVSIVVASTTAGNLGVVAALNTSTLTVSGVADNAPGGTSLYTQIPGATFHGTATDNGDVWVCTSLKAGATAVTITFSAADTTIKDGFFCEVSGLSSPVTDGINTVSAQTGAGDSTDTGAAVTTTATDGFIFGVIVTSNSITQNPKTGNEFTSGGDIQPTTGNSQCTLISTTAATHTPVWLDNAGGATFGAATVAFKAGATADIGQATYRQRGGRGPTQGPSMRRMMPQQFPAPGQIDAVTSAAQIQPLRARGLGIGPRLRRTFPQQFPQAGIATVTAKVGPYTWAGAASSLAVLIGAQVGAWTWSGKSSPLSTEVPGKVGAYTWAGKQASLAAEVRSTVGAYTWAGKTASLAASLVSRVGPYTWSGVKSAVPKQITEAVGTYTWAGRSATFGSTVTFSSTVGAYAWSGITSPVLRFVSSTTGAYNWLGSAAVVVSGAAPVAVERFSGGWEYARRARKRLEEELRTEREQWGILPKAAQIVSAVAIRQADALDLDPEQRLEELERELELAGVRYQAQYLELLNLQRQRLIDAEIRGYFEAEEALGEENKRRLMLLLAFLS